MLTIRTCIEDLSWRERGTSRIEYGIVVALVSLLALTGVRAVELRSNSFVALFSWLLDIATELLF